MPERCMFGHFFKKLTNFPVLLYSFDDCVRFWERMILERTLNRSLQSKGRQRFFLKRMSTLLPKESSNSF